MTVTELRAKIKSKELGGAYIFAGEEDYLKRFYSKQISDAACPDGAFAAFNKQVFEGGEIDFASVREAISSPPMFADYKVIEHKYPDLDHMKENSLRALIELAEACAEHPYAVFIITASAESFDAGSVRRPSKLAARLGKIFNLVNFERSTDAQLVPWVRKHIESDGVRAEAEVPSAIIFRSGHSMQNLASEIEKLTAYAKAHGRDTVSTADVTAVCSSTVECDAFALSSAISEKNRARAFEALYDMQLRRLDSAAILATLARAFSETATVAALLEEGKDSSDIEELLGWNPYRVKICISSARRFGQERLASAISRLRELDAASKSGGISGMAPIEMFICEFV